MARIPTSVVMQHRRSGLWRETSYLACVRYLRRFGLRWFRKWRVYDQ
jgi:hypothetical protein